ncbi:MAG: RtcB family protein [Treponema sp.]|jgi:RNA-splicing ligase RtcB|nr:RtcB family protein [Treponema sp.]
MLEINGRYNSAKVFTDNLDDHSREQIKTLCDQSFTAGSTIRLMPDVHAGAGCTIGTTMTIRDKVVPNLVGVDIGCGMETLIIPANSAAARDFDPARLDAIIHAKIPSGRDIRDYVHAFASKIAFDKIRCPKINLSRAQKSVGTLGGGNHFIEADRDEQGNLYIVIHSGSRHLGKEIAEYYQAEAWAQLNQNRKDDVAEKIAVFKAAGRQKEIQSLITEARVIVDIPQDLAYVSGELFDAYINDMKIVQFFAALNRKAMMAEILSALAIPIDSVAERFTTVHNYIAGAGESMILRKGAVSARAGEKLLIPINMRDGSLVCEGLGNSDWNYSAPHGAGRVMSRTAAFATLSMEAYEESMSGIYSTSINKATLDESPMAYKSMDEIVANIAPTAHILNIIKPIYNYKASE